MMILDVAQCVGRSVLRAVPTRPTGSIALGACPRGVAGWGNLWVAAESSVQRFWVRVARVVPKLDALAWWRLHQSVENDHHASDPGVHGRRGHQAGGCVGLRPNRWSSPCLCCWAQRRLPR